MAGGIGTQTFSNSLTYNNGSTFAWDLNGATFGAGALNQGSYDKVVVNGDSGALTANSGATFQINLSDTSFTSTFWNSPRQWDNIFTGSGVTLGGTPLFTNFSGSGIDLNGSVLGEGSFSFTSGSLNWNTLTPIPEPGSLLALGCLVGSGLSLRSRRRSPLPAAA